MKHFKQFLLIVMVALISLTASAYDFKVDGIYYNILSQEDLTCEVTYKNDNYHSYSGDIVIPSTVTYSGKIFSVSTIGKSAFSLCYSRPEESRNGLTSVVIPNSVNEIGESAFFYCTDLTEVKIPNSVNEIGESAFAYCSNLTSFTGKFASDGGRCLIDDGKLIAFAPSGLGTYIIPNEVTIVGNHVFQGCDSLTSVTIPDSVTTIGEYAFYGCSSLTSVEIPLSVTSIGWSAFCRCTSLTSVEIPNSVTEIGDAAFGSCMSLTSVTIPNSVTSIGSYTFISCSALTSVTIPNSVTSIGYAAFQNCSKLLSVTIGNSVTSIGSAAFLDCNSLAEIISFNATPPSAQNNTFEKVPQSTCKVIVPNATAKVAYSSSTGWSVFSSTILSMNQIISYTALTKIAPNAKNVFGYGATYNDELSTFTNGQGKVVFNGEITSIGEDAFSGCINLTSVEIPNSVTEIGEAAFAYCNNLTSFTGKFASDDGRCLIEDGKLIAFAPSGLTEYSIPDYISTIGRSAFSSCSKLLSVEIPNSVTSIGWSAFSGCSSLASVEIPNSVKSIDCRAFCGCYGLTSFTGKFASDDNRCLIVGGVLTSFAPAGLTSYEIPNSVNSIGDCVFASCKDLTSVTIGNSVTSIGWYAFSGCSSLTSITFPNSVTSIEEGAFYDCSGLILITSLAATPPSIIFNSFYGVSKDECVLNVPEWSVSDYKHAAYWNEFKDIEGIAYDFEIDGFYYKVISLEDMTCELVFGDKKYLGEIAIPSTITYSGKTFSVSSIGKSAFYSCSDLISVTIPNSVTSIGSKTFRYCSSLASVEIPNSVIKIGERSFENCSTLTSVVIPNTITSIEDCMFSGCSSLASVEIPNSVTSIGWSAFSGCSSLASVTIGNSVTSIGSSAFSGCSNLTSIEIPNSVIWIGDDVFDSCTSLPIENNLRYADTYLVEAIDKTLSVYTMKEGTKWIGKYAFSDCSSLTSAVIPNTITSIGERAFQNCSNLISVTIPNSVTSIGQSVFEGTSVSDYLCDNENYINYFRSTVKNLTLGGNVNSISSMSNWEKLEKITINNSNPPAFSVSNPFTNKQYMDLNIYVPEDAIEFYKKTDIWKDFWNLNGFSTDILSMEARKAVLISTQGGNIIVSGTERGESIQLYTIDGQQLRSVSAEDSETVIPYNVSKGEVVIVKYGNKSVKVLIK